MRKLTSSLGLLGFLLLIGISIRYPQSQEFHGILNVPSLLLVGVGHLCIVFYSYSFQEIVGAWKKIFLVTFFKEPDHIQEYSEKLVSYSRQVQKSGRISDSTLSPGTFLKEAVDIFNNNYPITELKRTLKNKWEAYRLHGTKEIDLFTFGAMVAPALGMMGTILGLIGLLQNMEDFSRIGAGMALALLTTLYGLIISYGIYYPLARRLQLVLDRESFLNAIILEGLELMKSGVHGPMLKENLDAFTVGEVQGRKSLKPIPSYNTVQMEIE